MLNSDKSYLITDAETQRLRSLFRELDPRARKVALKVCHAYKRRGDIHAQEKVREECKQFLKNLKLASKALRSLESGLLELDARTRSSLGGNRLAFLWDLIREAHMLGQPALLPIFGDSILPEDYFRLMQIADPAQPFEEFFRIRKAAIQRAAKETRYIDELRSARLGRMTKRGTFSRGGGIQYALMRLFHDRAKPRPNSKQIEERVSKVLKLLDGGGANIDADTGGCAAVRKAIKRLPEAYKHRCDQYLNYHLGPPSSP